MLNAGAALYAADVAGVDRRGHRARARGDRVRRRAAQARRSSSRPRRSSRAKRLTRSSTAAVQRHPRADPRRPRPRRSTAAQRRAPVRGVVAARRARRESPPREFRARASTREDRGRTAGGHRRDQEGEPEQGRAARRFRPAAIAASYERGGAACLSVLTDRTYFQGEPEYLVAARARVRAAGAAQGLHRRRVPGRRGARARRRRDPADRRGARRRAARRARGVRATTRPRRAGRGARRSASSSARCSCDTPLVGINNRNLRTFDVSLQTTLDLLPRIPPDRLVVTESGILAPARRRADARARRPRVPGRRGVHARARPGRGAGGAVRLNRAARHSALYRLRVARRTRHERRFRRRVGHRRRKRQQALDDRRRQRARRRRAIVRVRRGHAQRAARSVGLRQVDDAAPDRRASRARTRAGSSSPAATSHGCRLRSATSRWCSSSYALFPHLSVAENIVFGLRVRKVGAGRARRRLARVADLLGLSRAARTASRRSSRAASSSAWRWAARSSPRRRCA